MIFAFGPIGSMVMIETGAGKLLIEVAVAWPEFQVVIPIRLPEGATVADALTAAGMDERFPQLELHPDRLGVFGEKRKPTDVLKYGDRVEVYRPLKVDPKQARRLAAEARKLVGNG